MKKLFAAFKRRWISFSSSALAIAIALAQAFEWIDLRSVFGMFIEDERVLGFVVAVVTIVLKVLSMTGDLDG